MSVSTPLATRSTPQRTATGRPLPLWYSLLLAVPLTAAPLYGLLADNAYRTPADIAAQGRGQDLLTLLTVPVLLWAASRARAGSLRAHLLWLGLMLYYLYSYLMYALATPYNDAFLAYLAALALSGYGLLNGLVRIDVHRVRPAFGWLPRRGLGWYLLAVGAGFAVLELAPILAALPGKVPAGGFAPGMPNPVYVLDLTLVLPLCVTTAVLLWRDHPASPVLAAIVLAKKATLGLAILLMIVFQRADGIPVNPVMAAVFATITAVDLALLTVGATRMRPITAGWLRKYWWPTSPVAPTTGSFGVDDGVDAAAVAVGGSPRRHSTRLPGDHAGRGGVRDLDIE